MITGKPQTGKPMKARLSNLQARTIEDFKSEVAEKLSMQQDILMKIASELGLNKDKDGKQKG